jgi:hypothetical protein
MTCAITLADAIAALVAQKCVVGYKYTAEARVLARSEPRGGGGRALQPQG